MRKLLAMQRTKRIISSDWILMVLSFHLLLHGNPDRATTIILLVGLVSMLLYTVYDFYKDIKNREHQKLNTTEEV